MNEENFELDPVEINPERYVANLFGEAVEAVYESDEDLIGPKARAEFNVFAFTDAVGSRKKRDAWVLYQKALASGMSAEEIFYKLFWQVKTMMLAAKTRNAEEADMKSFPYSKAKGFLKNFKPGELEKISQELVAGYHNVRKGREETETFIEKTLLNI